MLWNIFCKVIDNHGDIGVCWRLCADLASRGQQVLLWVDNGSALDWMAPQGRRGVEVRAWTAATAFHANDVGDILVEAFGCEVAPAFIALHAQGDAAKRLWLNLEYLSAEAVSSRNHGLPSPVLDGPGAGLTKYFFYPGFQSGTGGLLRERDLHERQAGFDATDWFGRFGVPALNERRISLFCYEPALLQSLLEMLARQAAPTRLLVTAGRASAAVRAVIGELQRRTPGWNDADALTVTYLPLLSQADFDHMLWSCDLNFVRGEDSLVRALWAGRPLIWQVYPQSDDAHHAKLQAWLDWLHAPVSLRAFHHGWNAIDDTPLPALDEMAWDRCFSKMRDQLLGQPDLCTQLLQFVAEKR